MLQFNTSQFSYRGKNRFDITYKANSIFSPTKQIVYWYNNMSKENYTKKYYELMRESYKNNFNEWQSILNKEHLTNITYDTHSTKIMNDFLKREKIDCYTDSFIIEKNKKKHILFSKVFKKRKTIILSYYNNKFYLDIYDRNNIINMQKHSIRNIQKYLKKNLSNNQVLEIESLIFEII